MLSLELHDPRLQLKLALLEVLDHVRLGPLLLLHRRLAGDEFQHGAVVALKVGMGEYMAVVPGRRRGWSVGKTVSSYNDR